MLNLREYAYIYNSITHSIPVISHGIKYSQTGQIFMNYLDASDSKYERQNKRCFGLAYYYYRKQKMQNPI